MFKDRFGPGKCANTGKWKKNPTNQKNGGKKIEAEVITFGGVVQY